MKPLFIPLKAEYFDAFRDGSKDTEFRKFGARWNERTCMVVGLWFSPAGYGKSQRLNGIVSGFEVVPAKSFGGLQREAMRSLYGSLEFDIACIGIATTGAAQ